MLHHTKRLKSKLNALRHGIYSKSGLLPWEDPEEFAARRRKTLDSLRPWHPMLEQTAEEIVMLEWMLVRNQRSTLFYALCEPFGREIAKYKGKDWTENANKLISQRDAALLPIAEASRAIIGSAAHVDEPKQSKRLEKIGKKIAIGINRIAKKFELTSAFFLGLDDQNLKQAQRAMEIQTHLQKMRAQYFELEQWLVTRNKLVPQLEMKPASDGGTEVDDLMADDNGKPLVRRIAKDHRDDAEHGESV
jgi:hypothetical protein